MKTLTADEIQGIHSIEFSLKGGEEVWIVKHLQAFDRQSGQTVITIGHLVPPSLGILWNQLSQLFIELHGCDEMLWRECNIMRLMYPISSAKGNILKIKAANPSAYGIQNATAQADWHSISPDHKALIEAIETCVIDWLVERAATEAKSPKQLELLSSMIDRRLNSITEEHEAQDD